MNMVALRHRLQTRGKVSGFFALGFTISWIVLSCMENEGPEALAVMVASLLAVIVSSWTIWQLSILFPGRGVYAEDDDEFEENEEDDNWME